jgi:hypothetical protein
MPKNQTFMRLGVKVIRSLKFFIFASGLPDLPVGSTYNSQNYPKISFLRLRTNNLEIFIRIRSWGEALWPSEKVFPADTTPLNNNFQFFQNVTFCYILNVANFTLSIILITSNSLVLNNRSNFLTTIKQL